MLNIFRLFDYIIFVITLILIKKLRKMAKTNVKYVNKTYGVNKNEKTVKCNLDYVIDLDSIPGINFLCNLDEFNDFINTLIYCEGVKYIKQNVYGSLQFRVREIAFCSTEDEFDELTGKRLALTRAQKQAFRNTKCFYDTILSMLGKYYSSILDLYQNCYNSEQNCHNHEFELTNSVR